MAGLRPFAAAATIGLCVAAAQGSAQTKDAAAVLAAARQALGGDSRLSAIKTFTATGRTRQVRGENLVPIEFEIAVELPDKYLRKDEIPAQESGPNASGFNGDQLLQDPPPPTAPPPARLTGLKQDFARLTLGMFATSFSAYPLTFVYAGLAEAPQGKADVLDAKGAQGFTMRLFVDAQTHLPLMVTWQGPAAMRGPVPPSGRGAPPGPPPQAPPENRLYFGDYRDAGGGVQFPFRLRRAIGPETVEETTFDRFRVNLKIDPKKFEVRK